MAALLYVDLLGLKARWRRGGRAAAEEAFDGFTEIVSVSLRCLPPEVLAELRGGVQSDAAAFVLPTAHDAIVLGRVMYQLAFQRPQTAEDNRFWLRGVIVECEPDERLWAEAAIDPGLPHLTRAALSPALLDAIAVEQAGVKGMRLLIEKSAMGSRAKSKFTVWLEPTLPFRTIRSMRYNPMPEGISERFVDVLWMMPNDLANWPGQLARVNDRVRWSGRDPEETAHAAATLVMIHSIEAMLVTMRKALGVDEFSVGRRYVKAAEAALVARVLAR